MVKRLCTSLVSNLRLCCFHQALDETIVNSELLSLRKREVRFKKWQENVYIPTRKAIATTIDREFERFKRKKQKSFLEYLDFHNTQVSCLTNKTGVVKYLCCKMRVFYVCVFVYARACMSFCVCLWL